MKLQIELLPEGGIAEYQTAYCIELRTYWFYYLNDTYCLELSFGSLQTALLVHHVALTTDRFIISFLKA